MIIIISANNNFFNFITPEINSITFYFNTDIIIIKKASNNSLDINKAYGSLIHKKNPIPKRKVNKLNSISNIQIKKLLILIY